MRILIGAGAALLFASVAAAQPTTTPAAPTPPALPSACGEAQAAPTLPDPAHASAAQMTRANQTYEAWATDTRTKLQCRQAEIRALAAQVNAAETAYNAQAATFSNTVNSWTAATTAFNHRNGSSSTGHSNQRGSVMGSGHGPY